MMIQLKRICDSFMDSGENRTSNTAIIITQGAHQCTVWAIWWEFNNSVIRVIKGVIDQKGVWLKWGAAT